jgi:hypothetical protein
MTLLKQPTMKSIAPTALLFAAFTAAAGPTQTVFTAQAGECMLSLEASPQWQSLRLRVQHPHYQNCPITQQDVQAMLAPALAKLAEPGAAANYASLSLGRLIDYPWLSAYLAETAMADRQWNTKKGKPVAADINAYVGRILSAKEVLQQFQQPFDTYHYKVAGASVEKVLVGGFENVPYYQGRKRQGRIPFDAQVWLILQHD